ncbi:MAG: HAD-IA family hydrolase [Acidimicrobiales bacterium]
MIGTVLLDLDGVVRHFDPDHVGTVEHRHGLAPGALTKAAFDPPVLEPVITGRRTRAQWIEQVGRSIEAPDAVREWLAERGTIDHDMLIIVDELRARSTAVAILTNVTDTVADELRHFGVTDRFDAVFNSAEIGFAKPDRRAFEHVCRSLGVEPGSVFFIDDSASKLTGAIEIGMTARLFEGVGPLRSQLAALDLL